MIRILVLGISTLLFAAPQSAPQGNPEKGKAAMIVHGCIACHGYQAWGGAGAKLAQNPITFDAFVKYVRKPTRTMPAFGAQVTPTELADIYAYIKSIPPSPDPKTIPLLNDKD